MKPLTDDQMESRSMLVKIEFFRVYIRKHNAEIQRLLLQ